MNVLLLKNWLTGEGAALIGSRLQAVRQVDIRSFLLELSAEDGQSQRLLCSVLEEYPVLALVDLLQAEQLAGGTDEDSPEGNFVKAIRFHLLGYKLIGILQEGFDRSVTFSFSKTDMYGRESLKQLRLELVGRASNAYLLAATHVSRADGNVISIFKRVRREQNRVRHVVSGKPLPPPPPLGKFVAAESDEAGLAEELAQLGGAIEAETGEGADKRAISNPLELLFTRRVAASDAKLWQRIEPLLPVTYDLQTLHGFIAGLQRGSLSSELFGLGDHGSTANSVALAQWLEARGKRKQGGPAGAPQVQELAARLDQLNARLALALRAEELELLALEMLTQAEEIDAHKGGKDFIEAWGAEHPDWADELDLMQNVQENAQGLLRYSQRLRRGVEKLQRVIDHTTAQLTMLEQARPARPGEAAVKRPAVQADPLQAEAKRLNKYGVKYQRFTSSEGLQILCGMSDTSNDGLLRIYGSGRHLWLHARDFAGSHVIVLSNGKEVGEASLLEAALIAAYHSQGRTEDDVEVSYLPIKHLRRPKGGKPGQVLKTSEKVVNVRPADYEVLKLGLRG